MAQVLNLVPRIIDFFGVSRSLVPTHSTNGVQKTCEVALSGRWRRNVTQRHLCREIWPMNGRNHSRLVCGAMADSTASISFFDQTHGNAQEAYPSPAAFSLGLIGIRDCGKDTLLFKFGSQDENQEETANLDTAEAPSDSLGQISPTVAAAESEESANPVLGDQQQAESSGPSLATDVEEPHLPLPEAAAGDAAAAAAAAAPPPPVEEEAQSVPEPAPLSLKLDAAVCCMPHSARVSRGGEDAHLLEENWVGVADGLGCWAEQGVNSGLYSRELLWNCVEAIRSGEGEALNPVDVLEEGHGRTDLRGSCTATLGVLEGQTLRIANIGDSGFLVVRPTSPTSSSIISRSVPMLHDFNDPFHIGCDTGDDPSDATEYSVAVQPGDILVLGTDGLFDNVFDEQIVELLIQATEDGKGSEFAAKKVATLAHRQSESPSPTPFSEAAKEAGQNHEGGKRDDVTVVVAYIQQEQEE